MIVVLIHVCFFLSGASALIYEVVWTKMLTLVIGSTVYSISTVLVAFMGGLALGSYFGGRLIDRKGNPLLVYGVLEGLIGLYCLLIPALTHVADPVFSVMYNRFYTDQFYLFSLLRFVICTAILIIPTSLMGATLPVLSRYFVDRQERFGWSVGRLYAVNTFGAVLGAFGSGFILLPAIGQWRTTVAAAGANMLISSLVIGYWFIKGRKSRAPRNGAEEGGFPEERANVEPEENHGALPGVSITSAAVYAVLIGYAANGFAGMTYQIAWARALSLSFGSSTYSFSIILTAFILGLAFGSALSARVVDRLGNPVSFFGWVEVFIGFTALVVIWGLGRLPVWTVPVILSHQASYNTLLMMQFGIVLALVLAPTFLMGMAFPLAVKAISIGRSGASHPGGVVGLAYGWNTGGAIVGSFLAGFIAIPLLGIQKTIWAANIVNWAAGFALLGFGLSLRKGMAIRKRRGFFQAVAACAALVAVVGSMVFMPPWNKYIMDVGPFVYASMFKDLDWKHKSAEYARQIGELLSYEEGITTTVTVRKQDDIVFLRVNGKTDASSGTDMATQVLSGHMPLLFNSDPKDVLVVGLASGITLGAVTTYPSVKNIDVVEISEGVVRACGNFFSQFNHNALEDPRVNLIIGDGRNHLRQTNRKYDVVISEPSNPWIAGISSLFTKEYFQAGREHLKPGGTMLIWMQGYHMDLSSLQSVVKTFSEVYPTMALLEMGVSNGSDFGLMGFNTNEKKIDCAPMIRRLRIPAVANDLKRVGLDSPARALSAILLGPDEVKLFSRNGRIHTDDNLFLEYEAPKNLYSITTANNIRALLSSVSNPLAALKRGCLTPEERVMANRVGRARREFLMGLAEAGQRTPEQREKMLRRFERSLEINGDSERVRTMLRRALLARIADRRKKGDLHGTVSDLRSLLKWFPDDGESYFRLGVVFMESDEGEMGLESARAAFMKAIEYGYRNAKLYHSLGAINLKEGELAHDNEGISMYKEALSNFREAIELDPQNPNAWNGFGVALMKTGDYEGSKRAFGKALIFSDDDSIVYMNLAALALEEANDTGKALDFLKKAEKAAQSEQARRNIEQIKKSILNQAGQK